MPEVKFYCPEEKLPALLAFKERFGKTWGKELIARLEDGAAEQIETDTVNELFDRIFGDIENETDFLNCKSPDFAQAAIRSRLTTAAVRYKDAFPDLRQKFIDTYPRLARLAGYKTKPD